MTLFDSFPSQDQDRQLKAWVVPAAVVYLHCPWVLKSCQDKYLIVGAIEPVCLLLMVNTDPRRVATQTQVPLCVTNYSGVLTSDCFVNCNRAETQITYEGVKQQIRADGGRYRGRLTRHDQRQVVAAIKFAQDISPIHQQLLCDALDEAA